MIWFVAIMMVALVSWIFFCDWIYRRPSRQPEPGTVVVPSGFMIRTEDGHLITTREDAVFRPGETHKNIDCLVFPNETYGIDGSEMNVRISRYGT